MIAPRNSGGAWVPFIQNDYPSLRKRMKDLRSIGAKYVRLWFPWSKIEKEEGRFEFSYFEDIISNIVASGLKLDITLATIMAPMWFWHKYPDAYMINQRGQRIFKPRPDMVQSAPISIWHPQIKPRYEKFIDQCFIKSLNHWAPFIYFFRISMGRLNEPTYPDKNCFCCYDPHAQKDFRDKMKEKYTNITALNSSWSSSFYNFAAIKVPKPDQFKNMNENHRRDFIYWYRDSKDQFVLSLVDRLQSRLKPHQKIIVFPAGLDDADKYFDGFIKNAKVHFSIRHMDRNFWLLEQCKRLGLYAQYAGVGIYAKETFTATLIAHYKAKGYTFPIYAQIPGLYARDGKPNDPDKIAQLITELGYYGFAWNKDRHLYQSRTRPNQMFNKLKRGFSIIERHYGGDYANPKITNIKISQGSNSATIDWETNKPCDSVVVYGIKSGFMRRVSKYDQSLKREHSIQITNLDPNVIYYYVVASSDEYGNFTCANEKSFRTKK
jgi:hypothetical protein